MTESLAQLRADVFSAQLGMVLRPVPYNGLVPNWRCYNEAYNLLGAVIVCSAVRTSSNYLFRAPRNYDHRWTTRLALEGLAIEDHYSHAAVFAASALCDMLAADQSPVAGFLTHDNVFLTREEAFAVVVSNGQLPPDTEGSVLCSEMLTVDSWNYIKRKNTNAN